VNRRGSTLEEFKSKVLRLKLITGGYFVALSPIHWLLTKPLPHTPQRIQTRKTLTLLYSPLTGKKKKERKDKERKGTRVLDNHQQQKQTVGEREGEREV